MGRFIGQGCNEISRKHRDDHIQFTLGLNRLALVENALDVAVTLRTQLLLEERQHLPSEIAGNQTLRAGARPDRSPAPTPTQNCALGLWALICGRNISK